MEELYGCSINFYNNSDEFVNGVFIVGYLNQRIDKFQAKDYTIEVLDIRIPLSKIWLNTTQIMPFLRDYNENINDRKVEFKITSFFGVQTSWIFTGRLEVNFGSLSYEYDPDNDPYLHFTLKDWKLKSKN